MYHSNIITAYKSQGVIGQEKVGVNIISNPMACLSEIKLKITNIITARDLQISSAKENSPAPKLPKKETARVNISDTVVKVEPKTDRLPFVVPGGGEVVHYATHFTPTISRLVSRTYYCTANDGVKEEISIIKKNLILCLHLSECRPSC
jgi:hypothetical protein